MILLLGFRDFEDFDVEYQLTGTDALRVAQLVDCPGCRTNAVAYVTILPRGLDNADQTKYPIGYTEGGDAQSTLFDGRDEK